jgi:hypothetical protein
MTCDDCAAAKETAGQHRQFDNRKCLWCAARLIQQIGRLPITRDEATARRRAALADATAAGLDEQQIRELAKDKALAIAPKPEKK